MYLENSRSSVAVAEAAVQTILVVDDNAEIRWMMETAISQRQGTTVVTADCGKRALELINENEFDLIISDLNMPNGNGEWLLSQIKDKRHAPAMIVSGEKIPLRKLREMGAIGSLPKPHSKEDLNAVLDFLLGSPDL